MTFNQGLAHKLSPPPTIRTNTLSVCLYTAAANQPTKRMNQANGANVQTTRALDGWQTANEQRTNKKQQPNAKVKQPGVAGWLVDLDLPYRTRNKRPRQKSFASLFSTRRTKSHIGERNSNKTTRQELNQQVTQVLLFLLLSWCCYMIVNVLRDMQQKKQKKNTRECGRRANERERERCSCSHTSW